MSLNGSGIWLEGRPAYAAAYGLANISRIARNYRRISRAVGGFYSGSFYVSPEDVGGQQLQNYFNNWIGCAVREMAYGATAWEGIVYKMQLTLGGAVYEISLEPERWHNNVDVYYADLAITDINQGAIAYPVADTEQAALSYTTEGADATFTDAGQNFDGYGAVSGYAVYRIDVTNTDGTLTWAYLGEDIANVEVRVYTDTALTIPGWNGQNPGGLTPNTYNVVELNIFSDAGQDFSDWQTIAGDSLYRIQVSNSDNTTSWGYLGPVSVGNTRITVYTAAHRAFDNRGWNGDYPAGKTPVSYEVIEIASYGVRLDTGWSDNEDSVAEFGEMEYVITLPGSMATPATALRDRTLTENAWPRSRFIGTDDGPDSLAVTLAGFWGTTFWRYWEHSLTTTATTLITNLVTDAQFVGVGRIGVNTMQLTADAYPIPQRIGDLLMRAQEMGDAAGNIWSCGVYENRDLIYEQAPTTAEYLWRNEQLLDSCGNPTRPELIRPGFYLRAQNILGAGQPPGSGALWDDPNVAYIDEVEWARDEGTLMLSLRNAGPSLLLRQQIVKGVRDAGPSVTLTQRTLKGSA